MGAAVPHPLVEQIATLFLRPGYLPRRGDDAINRARIAGEWATGQWVLVTGEDGRLWGWMSWYRVSDDVLALLRDHRAREVIERDRPEELLDGPHCYVATAVVAPWAPRKTYRSLYRLTCAANADAQFVCGHMVKRDGTLCWHQRHLQKGSGHLHPVIGDQPRAFDYPDTHGHAPLEEVNT